MKWWPALFLVLTGASWAQEPVWFLQMSDPQFGMYTADKDFTQETANFEFAIATANRLHPKFVVITGDLVNKPGDAAQIAELKRITGKLDRGIALHLAAGNHDVGNTPTPDSLALYRRNIGGDYYTFEAPGFEGIVLNSSLIQHPEGAPDEAARQEKWLGAELGKSNGRMVAVFQHIPFFLKTADEPDDYFNIPKATRARYLSLLEKAGVRYIFAGHKHQNSYGEAGPLHMITTGPVGMPLDDGASGFCVARIAAGNIEERFVDLAHLPNTLEAAFARAK